MQHTIADVLCHFLMEKIRVDYFHSHICGVSWDANSDDLNLPKYILDLRYRNPTIPQCL
jgi:hypothetical protein